MSKEKICCEKFQDAIDFSKIEKVCHRYSGETCLEFHYYLTHLYSVSDGDGYVDQWTEEDKDFEILFCPFCGKRL